MGLHIWTDALSRDQAMPVGLCLLSQVFQKLCLQWRALQVDLFASPETDLLHQFITLWGKWLRMAQTCSTDWITWTHILYTCSHLNCTLFFLRHIWKYSHSKAKSRWLCQGGWHNLDATKRAVVVHNLHTVSQLSPVSSTRSSTEVLQSSWMDFLKNYLHGRLQPLSAPHLLHGPLTFFYMTASVLLEGENETEISERVAPGSLFCFFHEHGRSLSTISGHLSVDPVLLWTNSQWTSSSRVFS